MNCPSCKMEYHHVVRFLFVRCLTTVLLVGGLGVEDRTNDLLVIFYGVGPKRKLPIKTRIT
jgi:hypothetical protein